MLKNIISPKRRRGIPKWKNGIDGKIEFFENKLVAVIPSNIFLLK
jgi:hypothetical protein